MKKIFPILLFLLTTSSCYYDKEEDLYGINDCNTENLTYSNNIEKIMSTSCAVSGCHVTGTQLNSYETYSVLKQDVDNGTILARVINDKTMPPGTPLEECDFKTIDNWIKQGAKE